MSRFTVYLESKDTHANKFWSCETMGKKVRIRFGEIGTPGKERFRTFKFATYARRYAVKQTQIKLLRRGYVRATQNDD